MYLLLEDTQTKLWQFCKSFLSDFWRLLLFSNNYWYLNDSTIHWRFKIRACLLTLPQVGCFSLSLFTHPLASSLSLSPFGTLTLKWNKNTQKSNKVPKWKIDIDTKRNSQFWKNISILEVYCFWKSFIFAVDKEQKCRRCSKLQFRWSTQGWIERD